MERENRERGKHARDGGHESIFSPLLRTQRRARSIRVTSRLCAQYRRKNACVLGLENASRARGFF